MVALIHKPIPIREAMKFPAGKAAVDAEWNKLETNRAWLFDTVQPRRVVIDKAKKDGRTVHFGTVMDLCHVKHAELSEEFWRYKGRVVFRGDQVRDESGFLPCSRNRVPLQVIWRLLSF